MNIPTRDVILTTGFALTVLVAGLQVVQSAALVDLNLKTYDILLRRINPGTPSASIVVVEVDGQSLVEFGRWPCPRSRLALLIRKILDAGAGKYGCQLKLHLARCWFGVKRFAHLADEAFSRERLLNKGNVPFQDAVVGMASRFFQK